MTDIKDLEKLTERSVGGLRIESVQESVDYINLLIYGPSGVGKTVLAGSSSAVDAMSPVLFVDIEGGTLSLADRYPNVERVRVQTWDQMQNVYDELYKGGTEFRTVVLDSLTEINKFSMAQIMDHLIRFGRPGGGDVDPDVPSQREWGKNIEQTRKLVRAFRDLPMNTIFTALSAENRDPRSGMTKSYPSLPGKLAGEVAGFVDIVAFYYIKRDGDTQKRLLLTQQTDKEVAKDRSGKLPVVVEQPTMETIYGYIFNRGDN